MTPEKIYHIYNHGNAGDNLFRCEENYRYFLQKFGEHIKPVAITYAFCLLPNHFHFLLQVREESVLLNLAGFENLTGLELEKRVVLQFSHFFNAYTKAFNKMYDRKGKLFLSSFHRKIITNSRQFINTWKYIHYNPVRHHFTTDPYEWVFSSIHGYRDKKHDIVFIQGAQQITSSDFEFTDLRPDWSDFITFDY